MPVYDAITFNPLSDDISSYMQRDCVYYDGTLYMCLVDAPSVPPSTDSNQWHDMTEPFFYKGSRITEDVFLTASEFETFINASYLKGFVNEDYSVSQAMYTWNNDTFGEFTSNNSFGLSTRQLDVHTRSLTGLSDGNVSGTSLGDPFIIPMLSY